MGQSVTCAIKTSMDVSHPNLLAVWTFWESSNGSGGAYPYTASVGDNVTPQNNTFYSAVGPTFQPAASTPTTAQLFYAKDINTSSTGGDTITVTYVCPWDPVHSVGNPACTTMPSISLAGVVVVEYSGLDTLNPLDSDSAGYSTSGNKTSLLDSGTVAPANANLLLFAGGTSDTTYTLTAETGFTGVQSNPGSITEQLITTSPNNTLQRATACLGAGASCPATPVGNWLMQMAVFRDASWTVAGGWPPARLGQILYASQFPGVDASAKIQNAVNGCPSAGCTVNALDLSDVGGTGSATIDPCGNVNAVCNKAVTYLLGPATYNISQWVLRPGTMIGGFGSDTVLDAVSLTNPVFVIPQASVSPPAITGVWLHDFHLIHPNAGNAADGFLLDCSNLTNGGMWYSRFEGITIQGFNKVSLHLRGPSGTFASANQFDTFLNVVIYRGSAGPVLSFPGGSQNASAYAVVSGGVIAGAVITNGGSYGSVPNCNITAGTGSGATCTVTLSGGSSGTVTAVNFSGSMSGYSYPGEAIRMEGANQNNDFFNAFASGVPGTRYGQDIYLGTYSSGSQGVSSNNFWHLTCQAANNCAQINGTFQTFFRGTHLEGQAQGGFLYTNTSSSSNTNNFDSVIDGSYFAADGSYHCPGGAGCAAGTGYLVSDATSGGCGGNSCPQYDSVSFIHNTWGQLLGLAPDNVILDGGTPATNPIIADYAGNIGTGQAFKYVNLFACNITNGTEGTKMPVKDDNTTVAWGSLITGGGNSHVLAYCDGSNWTVAAQ
jgi:hypothetical protein